jgi:RHS repeat-associated protein
VTYLFSSARNVTYAPWGAVSQLENGCVGSGCTNTFETYTYNNRLQPWMIEVGTAASGNNAYADYCLVYNYFSSWTPPSSCPAPSSVPTSGSGNNGNVMGYWYQDSVQSGFSHTASYGYDGVNRLNAACTLSGSQCATSGSNVYNLAFGYDQFGNMQCTGGVGGGSAIGYCPAWSYTSGTNQLSSSTGCTYDAAGNLTKDCSTAAGHTYQWDAEGRVASVDSGSTWTFTYNALGERVQWAYSNGAGANQQLFDPSGTWLGQVGSYDLVPWGAGYLVVYFGSETDFTHINNLSSTTVWTNHAGTAVEDILFDPWGQVWQSWGSGGYSFAQLPYYDTTTNTSITMLRHYSPNLGRWLSPDRMGGDITNPQSLNRYAYVLNNPCSLTDPLGLQSPCSFNIAVVDIANGLSDSQVSALQDELTWILNQAGVGAQFVQPGSAEYTITVSPYSPPAFSSSVVGFTPYVPTGPLSPIAAREVENYGFVFASNLASAPFASRFTPTSFGMAVGAVAAHEFGHWALPLPVDSPDFAGIMGPVTDSYTLNPIPLQFTPLQAQRLQGRCQALPGSGASPGGGAGGGGYWAGSLLEQWWWLTGGTLTQKVVDAPSSPPGEIWFAPAASN